MIRNLHPRRHTRRGLQCGCGELYWSIRHWLHGNISDRYWDVVLWIATVRH